MLNWLKYFAVTNHNQTLCCKYYKIERFSTFNRLNLLWLINSINFELDVFSYLIRFNERDVLYLYLVKLKDIIDVIWYNVKKATTTQTFFLNFKGNIFKFNLSQYSIYNDSFLISLFKGGVTKEAIQYSSYQYS